MNKCNKAIWGAIIILYLISGFLIGLIISQYKDVEVLCEETESVEFDDLWVELPNVSTEAEEIPYVPKEYEMEQMPETVEVTYEDAQILMRIAMAEAEGDGVEGKAMVMAVVLNRVEDERFPDSVQEVVFQPHQFSPISDGRYYKVEPDVDCHLALAAIECGEYNDIEALYFENAESSWQANHCQFLYKVGHHRFYK